MTLVVESRGAFEESLFAQHPLLLSRFYRFLMRHVAKFTLDRAVVLWAVSHSARAQVERDKSYVRLLHNQVKELVLDDVFGFESPVPMASPASWYRRCLVHANLTPTGFGDKVALEATACERPGLVANDGFRGTLAPFAALLLFRSGEPATLVEHLLSILARVEPERVAIETYLRNHVVRMHSMHQLTVGAVRTSSKRR